MSKSLIEQASARLEQLRQAGASLPEALPSTPAAGHLVTPPPPDAPELPRGPVIQPLPTSKHVELDFAVMARSGLLTPDAPRSQVAEQFRVIKRPLLRNATGRGSTALNHANLIMVTSSMPGEGKSFTSLNLAMSIAAELDYTVMLVDADVARPSLLRTLQLPDAPGLLDVLENRAEMGDVLLRTNVEKLTLLPSGRPHPQATELLASEAMRMLLDDMARRYPDRIIIFDSPPLLLTTEARVLATQMGQIVVVVQAERTPQRAVQQALATIEACPVKLMVLNQVRGDSQGGYGYGYGYGYSASDAAHAA